MAGYKCGPLLWQGLPPAEGKVGWGKLMVTFPSADDLLDEVSKRNASHISLRQATPAISTLAHERTLPLSQCSSV